MFNNPRNRQIQVLAKSNQVSPLSPLFSWILPVWELYTTEHKNINTTYTTNII